MYYSSVIFKDETYKQEDLFDLDQTKIYNESNYPRNLIFEFSENIRPYYLKNNAMTVTEKQLIMEEAALSK